MTKKSWFDWVYYGAVLGLTAYSVYLLYNVSSGGNAKLKMLRGVSAACKSTASVVGKVGMAAENTYLKIIEAERMI